MHKIAPKQIDNAEHNSAATTWEFTTEDLDFSLFGHFTSKDGELGVNRRFQGNICFSLLLVKFKFGFCLFTWSFFSLGINVVLRKFIVSQLN